MSYDNPGDLAPYAVYDCIANTDPAQGSALAETIGVCVELERDTIKPFTPDLAQELDVISAALIGAITLTELRWAASQLWLIDDYGWTTINPDGRDAHERERIGE